MNYWGRNFKLELSRETLDSYWDNWASNEIAKWEALDYIDRIIGEAFDKTACDAWDSTDSCFFY